MRCSYKAVMYVRLILGRLGENTMRFIFIIILGCLVGFMFSLIQESNTIESYATGFLFSVILCLDLITDKLDEILEELKNK